MEREKPVIYADHGSDEFNRRMDDVLRRLAHDTEKGLGDNLVALILGGGYGRGEGGIVVVDGVEYPYNDLDLTFIVKNKGAIDWKIVEGISRKYEHEIKIDVDFSRPLTIRDIENWPHTLMWYDLLNGHIILSGPDDILTAHAPKTMQEPVPAIEATRLLLNRGTGLLWGERVILEMEPPPDKDFVRRNYFKCALAMGDALLIVHRRFATPYRGRDERLIRLSEDVEEVAALELTDLYSEALKFKFSPDAMIGASFDIDDFQGLAKQWGEVFLHVERLRTGKPFELMDDYVKWRGIREPQQHGAGKLVRNIGRNLQLGKLKLRYPREELYRSLPKLLGLTQTKSLDWEKESERFLTVWNKFN